MKIIRLGALVLAVLALFFLIPRMLPTPTEGKGVTLPNQEAAVPVIFPKSKEARFEKARTTLRSEDDGKVLRIALDEVAVSGEDGRETIIRLDPPATYRTLRSRMLEHGKAGNVRPVAYLEGEEKNAATRRIVTQNIRVKMSQEQAGKVASEHGLMVRERPAYAPEWVVFSADGPLEALEKIEGIRDDGSVAAADVLLAVLHTKKALPNDTLINNQWHLKASGTALAGTDVNIENAWKYGATGGARGVGIRVGIVDDGLQTAHPDLLQNVDTVNDFDWNGNDNDPNPASGDDHGTSCAGNVGARGNNNLGVSGTAPESTLVGMRLIAAAATDLEESQAMAYLPQLIQIKSNSWGPSDDGRSLEAPGPMMRDAFANSAATGRGGRGTIFVWAGGNGGATATRDNSNYDGYANSIYTIAVGATDSLGRRADYAEPGANLIVCGPSSGAGTALGITTTDRTGADGYNTASSANGGNYADDFGGTSSSTPTVAGIIALMLEKNPNLGWRDVQEILIRSAKKIAPTDADWKVNGAGYNFNHNFGAGLVDATAAVTLATGWTNLGAQSSVVSTQTNIAGSIPNNSATGVTRTFSIPASNLRTEHVTLSLSITHAARGDLEISLTSPSGTVSRLAEVRNDTNANYPSWTFSSVRNWGELSSGTWTLKVADRSGTNSSVGTLTSAELKVFGTSAAAVNPAPVVTITSPVEGSVTSPGATVVVRVDARDFDVDGNPSTVSQVQLFRNGILVGTNTTAPFDFSLNPPPGTNVYTASATDVAGKVGSSSGLTTMVTNQPPVIAPVALNFTGQAFADTALQVASVPTTDPENDPITFSYQWESSIDGESFRQLPGATSSALPVATTNSGKVWRCIVSASDGFSTVSAVSPGVNILDRPATTAAPGSTYSYQSGLVLKGVRREINRQAIIQEFSQGPAGGTSEWIEFLALKTGSLRFWDFQDAAGNIVVFNDTSVWDNVPAGTVIVVYNGSTSKDPVLPANVFDKANGRIVVSSRNATYFDPSYDPWPPLGNAGDSIFLSDADSTTVHEVAYGNSTVATPNVGSVGSGRAAYFGGDTDAGADDGSQWQVTTATTARSLSDRAINPASPGTVTGAVLSVTNDKAPLIGVTPAKGNTPKNLAFVTALKNNTLNSAPVFRIAQGSALPAGLSISPTTGLIGGTLAAGASGNFPIIIELVNANGDLVSQSFTLAIQVAGTTFASYIAGFNVADKTATGDSEGDGLPNLVEYALNLRPDLSDAAAVINGKETGAITLTYARDKTVTDVMVSVEWSPTLAQNSWLATGITVSPVSETATVQTLKASLPIDPAQQRRFLRLKAVSAQ